MRRVIPLAACTWRGPAFFIVMRHAFDIRLQAVSLPAPPFVCSGDIKCSTDCFVVSSVRYAFLACVEPLEDAIRRNLLIHYVWQAGHFQVLVSGNEATAVAVAAGADGEGNHIAALQLEGADAVVQLRIGQRVHETVGVLGAEIADRLAAEIPFRIDGQRTEITGVGHNNGALVIHLNLAVIPVNGLLAVNLDVTSQQIDCSRRLHGRKDEHGVVGIGNVHNTAAAKRCSRTYHIVNIGRHGNGVSNLHNVSLTIGSTDSAGCENQ